MGSTLAVARAEGGLVVITSSGAGITPRDFVCEASSAGWLAERIDEKIRDYRSPYVRQALPPDDFMVLVDISDRVEDEWVRIRNFRDPGAPRGRHCQLPDLSLRTEEATLRKLVADLRAVGGP